MQNFLTFTHPGNLNELPLVSVFVFVFVVRVRVRCLIAQVATMNHEKGGRHKSF